MSLAWIRQPKGSTFEHKSACGFYGVDRVVAQFEANHIDALWAKPQSLGFADTVDGAKQICEQHRAKQRAN